MAFRDFTFPQVEHDLGLHLLDADLFSSAPPAPSVRRSRKWCKRACNWRWPTAPRRPSRSSSSRRCCSNSADWRPARSRCSRGWSGKWTPRGAERLLRLPADPRRQRTHPSRALRCGGGSEKRPDPNGFGPVHRGHVRGADQQREDRRHSGPVYGVVSTARPGSSCGWTETSCGSIGLSISSTTCRRSWAFSRSSWTALDVRGRCRSRFFVLFFLPLSEKCVDIGCAEVGSFHHAI